MDTRRDFLQQAAALAGGARILGSLLSTVECASAIDPAENSSFLDAEHVVILMQENRSFDHVFGTLKGVRGFNDPRVVTLPDGNPAWLQSNAAGETYAPFRLDFKGSKATWLGSLPHSWTDQSDARNHGNHDGWLDAKKSHREDCAGLPLTMGFYDRADLPFYYALADAFTVCDQHFCSSLTGTTPNRLHLWTGTIREKPDPASTPKVRNSEVDYGSTARWKTFPERLEDAGISWRVYQNELSLESGLEGERDAWLANFTDNPLEWFDQYHPGFHKTHLEYVDRMVAALPAEIEALRIETARKAGGPQKELDSKEKLLRHLLAEKAMWTPETLSRLSARDLSIHRKAFTTNDADPLYRDLGKLRYREGGTDREMDVPQSDPLHQFRADVTTGKLPAVSWLVPSERFSDHPGSPWYGAWYLAEALKILTGNPEIWRNTIFILTYDENDGYFDHVPPFVAPDPGNPESGKTSAGIDPALEFMPLEQDLKLHRARDARGGPLGLGYRVPLIVASPWSRGGYVCSQVFDHTSVLQLLERMAGRWSGNSRERAVRETNITAWRRTVCGDLSSAFRPFEGASAGVGFQSRDSFFQQVYQAQFMRMPSGYRNLRASGAARQEATWMPRQEPGVRPSCALPYELAAEGRLNGARFEITLEARNRVFGKNAQGAPFHVYTPGSWRGGTALRTRAYAVEAGQRVTDSWELAGFANGVYHLAICGPNGFLREFAGSADDPRIDIRCEYVQRGNSLSGDIELRAVNDSAKPAAIHVKDLGYKGADRAVTIGPHGTQTLVIALGQSHRWYDLSVTITGDKQFVRRLAGRVETGEEGFSDPVMGRV